MVEWWTSVRTLAALVDAEYIPWEDRTEAVDLSRYLKPIQRSPSPPASPEVTWARLQSLRTAAETGAVLDALTAIDLEANGNAARVDAILAVGAVLLDIEAQTTRAPCEGPREALTSAVDALTDETSAIEKLQQAAVQTGEIARLVPVAAVTLDQLTETTFGHQRDDAETAQEQIQRALSDGDLNTATQLHQALVVGQWTRSDFDRFDPREFERLIVDLYREHGYDVHHQGPGPDGGIDAVAKRDGETKLIQVKHKSDAISAPTFDKYVALLQYYDPDEVVLVTSSSFTQPALTRWRRVADRVRPINGEQLRQRLSEASIVPPLEG